MTKSNDQLKKVLDEDKKAKERASKEGLPRFRHDYYNKTLEEIANEVEDEGKENNNK